jgi:hypothetical protein
VRHDLPDDEPIEQHPDRGQVLLNRRGSMRVAEPLDVSGDMMRADLRQLANLAPLAPQEKRAGVPEVCGSGVGISEVGRKKFQEAVRPGLAG